MATNWAEEHLQTIRTLMERSAVYRRALAPIMVWNGIVGIVGGIVGWKFDIRSDKTFIEFWSAVAVLAIVGSFLLVRRQALKDSEPFWSPPTRRVAQALCPPLFIGGFVNAIIVYHLRNGEDFGVDALLIAMWLWLYGCAACSAGFFMTRGIKLFGWLFIVIGCVWVVMMVVRIEEPLAAIRPFSGSLVMGLIFGGLHLAYGIYLYLTEKGKNAA
jgi:hypothetical protein